MPPTLLDRPTAAPAIEASLPGSPASAAGSGNGSHPVLEVLPLTPVLGAEIRGVDLRNPLEPAAESGSGRQRAGEPPKGPDGFVSQPLEGELFNVLG